MVETISQLTPSSNNTLYIHLIGNTSTGAILPKKGNGENTTNASNPVLSVTIGAINTINSNTPTTYTLVASMENHVTTNSQFGTSFLVAQPTETQGFVTKEELQRLLDEKKMKALVSLNALYTIIMSFDLRPVTLGVARLDDEKFFSIQEKVSLVDLGREYHKPKEDVMDYIQHFKVKVLNVQEAHDEDQLVKACIQCIVLMKSNFTCKICYSPFSSLVETSYTREQRSKKNLPRKDKEQLIDDKK
ncbi:hypothetical protein Goari_007103, partial [Gossypium aridum]|nr:hypothetical protein [Gossypium aridum]